MWATTTVYGFTATAVGICEHRQQCMVSLQQLVYVGIHNSLWFHCKSCWYMFTSTAVYGFTASLTRLFAAVGICWYIYTSITVSCFIAGLTYLVAIVDISIIVFDSGLQRCIHPRGQLL